MYSWKCVLLYQLQDVKECRTQTETNICHWSFGPCAIHVEGTMAEWKLSGFPVWKVTTFQVTRVFSTAVWGSSFKQNVSRNAVAGTWQSKRDSAGDTKQRPNWQIAPRQQLNSSQRLKIKVQDKAKRELQVWHFGTLELGWKICGAVASTQICSDLPSSPGLEVLVAYDKLISQNQVNCAACILQDRLVSAKIRNRGTRPTHHATCHYCSCRKPWTFSHVPA